MTTPHDEEGSHPIISPQVDQFMAAYEAELGVPSGLMLKLLTESD